MSNEFKENMKMMYHQIENIIRRNYFKMQQKLGVEQHNNWNFKFRTIKLKF